jgi:ParB-like chromosome segregation protein Spo0J
MEIDEILSSPHGGEGVRFLEDDSRHYVDLAHEELVPDPENSRPKNAPSLSSDSIGKLADSISEIGLLQNLVARAGEVGSLADGRFWLVAGERRWRAIGVLIERGLWGPEDKILCRVVEEGSFEHVAENEGHEEVPPWHVGKKFNVLIERGYTQMEIGKKIARSQQYVSICCRLARCLHPNVISRLDRMGSGAPKTQDIIARLLKHIDAFGDPIEERQMKSLEILLFKRAGERKGRNSAQNMKRRLDALRGYKGPSSDVVDAVLRYLTGVDQEFALADFRKVLGEAILEGVGR